ncbi:unnamed protein product, partial [Allacma fusca]
PNFSLNSTLSFEDDGIILSTLLYGG